MRSRRLRRKEQVEQNRERLLAAARRVFLARGFHGATLEAIAEEAGFSKGVVYSQFDSKDDLFLALLEARIDERAEQNERIATRVSGAAGLRSVLAFAEQLATSEPEWALLVLEFRAHAARDPELNARYALAHARTSARLAGVLARLLASGGRAPVPPPETMAELLLAIASGVTLERLAHREALPEAALGEMIVRAFGLAGAVPAAGGGRLAVAPASRSRSRGKERQ